uniref:Chemokine interleukin-8-like domain-containing protein n=1 Tax=Nothobranchius korthausae TaxID=1143690 RepID=A0A1A8H8Z5_9TELE
MLSFSSSRAVFLLSLVAVMFLSGSEGDDKVSCCTSVTKKPVKDELLSCYEQKPKWGCKLHAFMVVTVKNELACVHPDAAWFKSHVKRKDCAPVINMPSAFEDEDEDEEDLN